MPHLTPDPPPSYRRRALAALEGLVSRMRDAIAQHHATVERLIATGEGTTTARAGLGLARGRLTLLLGRQRFLRSGEK